MKYNIWQSHGMLIFNEPDQRGWVSKGFRLDVKNLQTASVSKLNHVSHCLALYLSTLSEPTRVQFQWSVDADYKKELESYNSVTESLDMSPWCYHNRKELYNRFTKEMKENLLRRERLYIYVTTPIKKRTPYKVKNTDAHYEELFKELDIFFSTEQGKIVQSLGALCEVSALTDEEHFTHYMKFCNPSFALRDSLNVLDFYDPENYPLNDCFQSEGYGKSEEFGFFLDDYYHNVIAIRRLPRSYVPSMIHQLTALGINDYTITSNIIPLNKGLALARAEKVLDRLEGDLVSENKRSLLTEVENARSRVDELASGEIVPLNIETFVRVWSKNKDELREKTEIIKTAINRLNSMTYFVAVNPATAKNMFYQTLPGWSFGQYNFFQKESNNALIADLIPFSGTFTGMLEKAEALYKGDNNNLVGIRTNINGTPQHGAIYGTSGTGKSVGTFNILSQISCFYELKVLFEEGGSYDLYTKLHGNKTIVIHPDAGLTINYFDTAGSPLTSDFMLTASVLVLQMAGGIEDDSQKRELTTARIMEYIEGLYKGVFKDLQNDIRFKNRMTVITRHAMAVKKLVEETEQDFLDAWSEYKQSYDREETESIKLHNSFTESEVSKFFTEEETNLIVRNVFFAFVDKEDFPTHSTLVASMLITPKDNHPIEEIKNLATLLSSWKAGKAYGSLFDGITSINFNPAKIEKGSVIQFELGKLSNSAKNLKKIAVFALYNYVKSAIINLPRKWQKFIHFEEAGRFMQIDGAYEMIAEGYEQMRKMNATVFCSLQQYDKIKGTPLEKTISNNSRLALIYRLLSTSDIQNLAGEKPLTPTACEIIQSYESPENLPDDDKYSSFMVCYDTAEPIVGTARFVASKEEIYVSNTTSSMFEEREKNLRGLQAKDLLNKVLETVYSKEKNNG